MSRSRSRMFPALLTGGLLIAVLVVAQAMTGFLSFGNPIREETVDRTGPAVLDSLSDLQDYHGATSELQVIVDLEKDTKYVPSFIKGERVLYQAYGSVDGVVSLSALGPDSVSIAADGTVTVTVPPAKLSKVTLDVERSAVIARDRGLLDRMGSVFSDNPTSEKALQEAGVAKLADAANETEILATAEQSASDMLTALLTATGATDVVVVFEDPAAPA